MLISQPVASRDSVSVAQMSRADMITMESK